MEKNIFKSIKNCKIKHALVIIFVLASFMSAKMSAQTYYYVSTKYVDKNNMVHKPVMKSTYFTFNGSTAYFSDVNGFTTGGAAFTLKEYDNQGNAIYGQFFLGAWMDNYLIVSRDRSVVNWDFGGEIQVYHRSSPQNDPSRNSRLIR